MFARTIPNSVALAAILCEDMTDKYDEEVACGSRFKIHGGPTVGRIHARQGGRD